MQKGYYPEHAIKELEKQHQILNHTFNKIWMVLSTSPERDEIMGDILSAKMKIFKLIENNKEENKND